METAIVAPVCTEAPVGCNWKSVCPMPSSAGHGVENIGSCRKLLARQLALRPGPGAQRNKQDDCRSPDLLGTAARLIPPLMHQQHDNRGMLWQRRELRNGSGGSVPTQTQQGINQR
eukprot:123456-Rhodomonas_salina.1